MAFLDLERHLRFYGAYHNDPVNVAIHIACVPILLWTGFFWGTRSGPLIDFPDWMTIPYLPLSLATVACIMWSALWIALEPVAGGALALIYFAAVAFAHYVSWTYGNTAMYIDTGVHITGWLLQFVGHGKFEGRAPALLDNLVQAIFLAPLFVWLEVMFKLGYRPELQRRVQKGIQEEITKFKSRKAAPPNGKANGHAKSS